MYSEGLFFRIVMKTILSILCICMCAACADGKKETIVVFHAGSLGALFKECKVEFEKQYNYTVLLESSGSIDAAQKIAELHKPCDVIALADIKLFDGILKKYCSYWIAFAGNEMVLAYNPKSRYAQAIAANWMDALVRYDITCARSDPLRDPCGYRTILVWKLASQLHNNPELEKIFAARSPVQYMRPKEIDCIPLLASICDAIWIYKSIAKTHNLPYVTLDGHINLGNPEYEKSYQKACITLSDIHRQYTVCGSTITYGISIPLTAVNTQGAIAFVSFLCGQKGKELIARHGFSMIRASSNQWDILPAELKKVVVR